MNKYDFLLKQFVGYDEIRPALSAARPQGEYVYGTDAKACIRIHKDLCKGAYEKHESQPDFTALFLIAKKGIDKVVTKSQLIDIMKNNAIKPHRQICPKCNGNGELECDCCGYTNECKKCAGSGNIEINFIEYVNDISLNISNIRKLLKTMSVLEIDSLPYHFEHKMMYIDIPDIDIQIIIASQSVSQDDED